MKKNFDAPILGLDGKEMLDTDSKPQLLRSVIADALTAPEQNLSGSDHLKRFILAQKVFVGGSIECTIDELALIKKLIVKNPFPIAVAQVLLTIEKTDKG